MDILIIKPSSLGDIIHGLQFAESLRSEIDNARISWVARELFAPLVQSCRTVHYTHIFHRKGSILGFVKLIREIRQAQFDWVLDLQGLLRSGILCKGARAKNKAGRSDAREGARWLYPINVPLPPTGTESHALEILMEFKRLFGQEPTGLPPIRFEAALGQASYCLHMAGEPSGRYGVRGTDRRLCGIRAFGQVHRCARRIVSLGQLPFAWPQLLSLFTKS